MEHTTAGAIRQPAGRGKNARGKGILGKVALQTLS